MIHLALVAALSGGPVPTPVDAIEATKTAALQDEKFAFCTDPAKPLGPRQHLTCSVARELDDCKGLVEACDADAPVNHDWLAKLVELLAPVAHVLLYAMIAVMLVAVAIPVIAALRQLGKRRRKKDASEAPNVAQVITQVESPPPEETDPEEALRQAEELLARGEFRRALSFSLVASLGALGRRGAIRLGKHRTNGEYVRSCAEETARPPLREIVRAVDAVEFGGAEATSEKAARAAARAREIVRAVAIVTTLGLSLLGCDPPKRGSDPAGDELPIAVLARNGYRIAPLSSSLATLPISENEEEAPVIVIDTERVPLESETQAHLLRWVEAGGTLVLFGRANTWPDEIRAKEEWSDTRSVTIEDFEARIGRRNAFAWKSSEIQVVARLGTKTYAAKRWLGQGLVLGVANDDLFTNVGVMPKHNAAALVTLIRSARLGGELRVAKPEDGVPPPSNPFAALIAAGLGKGAWHALLAAILLFLCYGIRHARPRAAPVAKRRAFAEHVAATGAFYSRAPARSHALAMYGRFVEMRLRELAPRGTDPAAFLASRTGAEPEHVSKILARALEAKPDEVPKGDELEIIGELRALMAKALTSQAPPRSAP
jgi:hypothetical protein